MKGAESVLTTIPIVGGILLVLDSVVIFCDGPLWLGIVLTAAFGVAVLALIGASAANRLPRP